MSIPLSSAFKARALESAEPPITIVSPDRLTSAFSAAASSICSMGGTPVREGDAFGLDELEKQIGSVPPRIDLLDAGRRRRPWESPGVDVEHRRDRHVDVVTVEAALLGCASKRRKLRPGVQHKLPMAEIHALAKASSPCRVERRCLRILVEIRKVVVGGRGCEEFLIFASELDVALHGRGPVGEDDECPHLVELRLDALDELNEFVVDQEH